MVGLQLDRSLVRLAISSSPGLASGLPGWVSSVAVARKTPLFLKCSDFCRKSESCVKLSSLEASLCVDSHRQPCHNVPVSGDFATYSSLISAYSTLDFSRSPLAEKGSWHLLPTTPDILPAATKHFDRADRTRLLTERSWCHAQCPAMYGTFLSMCV